MSSSNNNNMLITLLGLSALIFAFQKYNSNVVEHFGMIPTRTVKVDRVIEGADDQGFVTIPGQYQAMLNPRQAGMVDYGAFIRYNPPAASKMANNMGTLNYANMVGGIEGKVVEGYCGGNSSAQASQAMGVGSVKNSNMVPSGFKAGNYAQQYDKLNYNETTDMLPVQNMGMGVNALGQISENPIIYDRYMYANQRSRLQQGGVDRIRGDLSIVPIQGQWFRPSAHPNIDLASGALAVMGGINNDNSKELMALKSAASGGAVDTGSGINYSVQKSSFVNGSGGIQVSAFP